MIGTINQTYKVGNMYKKNFQYKGQMINYYNKLRQNKKLSFVFCGFDTSCGYTCEWSYKKTA